MKQGSAESRGPPNAEGRLQSALNRIPRRQEGCWEPRVRSWLAGIMRTKGERDRVMGSGMGTG